MLLARWQMLAGDETTTAVQDCSLKAIFLGELSFVLNLSPKLTILLRELSSYQNVPQALRSLGHNLGAEQLSTSTSTLLQLAPGPLPTGSQNIQTRAPIPRDKDMCIWVLTISIVGDNAGIPTTSCAGKLKKRLPAGAVILGATARINLRACIFLVFLVDKEHLVLLNRGEMKSKRKRISSMYVRKFGKNRLFGL